MKLWLRQSCDSCGGRRARELAKTASRGRRVAHNDTETDDKQHCRRRVPRSPRSPDSDVEPSD